ncbi:MAG: type I phosphomannose isomerase catalytic subunit [Bacteroidaceae bacterium]|nr:type I phosphomannose isomerase catalytic subunit [Bacteroidaceae bacterium]
MIRHLSDIIPVPTSHSVGLKRILLAASESGCSLTQIAITELKAGEIATAHVHPDMQEAFYVLAGELEMCLNGEKTTCRAEDFVLVEKCVNHELMAITDVRILTVGCVVESSRDKFYPMLFKPNRKNLVWGTEDWVVSAIPGSESEVENGTWARYRLSEVIAKYPSEILGRETAQRYNNELPLLTKIIDARRDLSIQVHPNDEMALREHNKKGKSEMWYILDAAPGSYLYAGFRKHISPEEYKQSVADGTICYALARHEVHPGDVFYLPAGRVHAICGGIRLVEVQQSSDVTYRIYDYNRPGLDGRPRELHTELAAKAIDYTVYPDYRTNHKDNSRRVEDVLDTPHFSVKILNFDTLLRRDMLKYDSFIIATSLAGDCDIRIRATGQNVHLSAGQSCLIPAVVADYEYIPTQASSKVLEAFINNRRSLGRIISEFLHL